MKRYAQDSYSKPNLLAIEAIVVVLVMLCNNKSKGVLIFKMKIYLLMVQFTNTSPKHVLLDFHSKSSPSIIYKYKYISPETNYLLTTKSKKSLQLCKVSQ